MGAASLTELEFSGMPDDAWAHAGGPDQRHALIVGRAHPESSKTRENATLPSCGAARSPRASRRGCRARQYLMRPNVCHSLSLDRDLAANILHVAVQEISHLLNGRAERETISEFSQIDRRPGPFALSAHGPPHRCPNRDEAASALRYFCGALWSREPSGRPTTPPMLGCGCSPNERKFSTPGGSTSGIVPTWRVENNRTASATRTPAPHARASRRACVTLQE
jgi:hypothetical protein